MRLWSIHPRYLDQSGLCGLWREGLLALKVLRGLTTGYKNHAQLIRFKQQSDPIEKIVGYLKVVCGEGHKRGYKFNESLIHFEDCETSSNKILVSSGQVQYELSLLKSKLNSRQAKNAELVAKDADLYGIQKVVHPMFFVVFGEIEFWERIRNDVYQQ